MLFYIQRVWLGGGTIKMKACFCCFTNLLPVNKFSFVKESHTDLNRILSLTYV